MKFFDYKFMIMLGLSMIVYFLYREVEQLNKRVTALETGDLDKLTDVIEELPLPPNPDDVVQPKQDLAQFNNNNTPNKMLTPVEEYSNDMIYSNDMNTNTNDQDTLMVESLVDMTQLVNNTLSSTTSSDYNDNAMEEMEAKTEEESISSEQGLSDKVLSEKELLKQDNTNQSNIKSDLVVENVVEDVSFPANKVSEVDNLIKNKLVELQEMATSKGISLVVDGSTKKKTKIQLAQEIYEKKNI